MVNVLIINIKMSVCVWGGGCPDVSGPDLRIGECQKHLTLLTEVCSLPWI